MKKQYVSLLAIILATSGFLFSCGDKMKKDTAGIRQHTSERNGTSLRRYGKAGM